MAYDYDIFISYRRSPTVGHWVNNHLVPRLEARLGDISPMPVRTFCDLRMEDGVNWSAELKKQLLHSRILLTVWSADYFRSSWCMAEWQSFRSREHLLGYSSVQHPQGLVYPIRYSDGENFHNDAKLTNCKKDFSRLNYPDDVFRQSPKYLDFDDLIREMSVDLIARLETAPPYRDDFPVAEPQPLSPVRLDRPVL